MPPGLRYRSHTSGSIAAARDKNPVGERVWKLYRWAWAAVGESATVGDRATVGMSATVDDTAEGEKCDIKFERRAFTPDMVGIYQR